MMMSVALVIAAGLVVAVALSFLPAEQLEAVGSVWGTTFRVVALTALAAYGISLRTRRR